MTIPHNASHYYSIVALQPAAVQARPLEYRPAETLALRGKTVAFGAQRPLFFAGIYDLPHVNFPSVQWIRPRLRIIAFDPPVLESTALFHLKM